MAPLAPRRAYLEVVGVYLVFFESGIAAAGFYVAGHPPTLSVDHWSDAVPAIFGELATTALCILVPVLLISRRGLELGDIGLRRPSPPSLSMGVRMAAWASLAIVIGAVVTRATTTSTLLDVPFSYPDFAVQVAHALQAGFIEEIVVLAFVVATLEQAGRSHLKIVAVAVVLRLGYHIYYGPGVVGIALWATAFVWLYLRYRTIVPLIVVHCVWDLFAVLGYQWHRIAGFEVLVLLGLFITAPILWLVDRGTRAASSYAGPGASGPWAANGPHAVASPVHPLGVPAGWYPAPFMTGTERWFDGESWTSAARPADPTTWGPPPA